MPLYRRLPTLTQLRHLIAVSEHGHFGRAAEACFITQSSLSASIRELETTLGETLIERTRRSVMMTVLGLETVNRAKNVIRDVEDIADLVSAAGAPLSGSLRLGIIPTIAPFLLPRVLPTLRAAYPELKLYLSEKQSAPLLDDLAAGNLDLLLLAFPYPCEKLKTFVFADDPFWVASPKGHLPIKKERLTRHDIAAENLLLLGEGHCLRDHALSACGLAKQHQGAEFQATSLQTLVQMVEGGLGVTLLPKMAIDAGIARSTGIQLRPIDGESLGRQIGFAWRPSSPREDEFKLLAAYFRDELATPLSPGKKAKLRTSP
ncbi:MAG: hydrogen peroxide-inducible genes activator [Rhodospirillaceae bacterium]|jgi:LysR family transcriptional regulator, hydrogen peroxide-inducible genes activator|nr:hydrogen peroxide-inducible genes activator [Rhodospirillaceae bacterium]MBT5243353.1 hydrogen peroxide-inducible genes activator [Rhodospirillaceae bacterium]MBT5561258.1 hydrogen peroxide-inducible genes activator [Rhodospirillaceae bacterium]MBT6243333.1 hydrogen peroxide-inducible genes activator [Rhodospirillaceae bacterium]MBT7136944.1 hydrogen peroxide-inducible genes activator [Rhodospirillaceae bacterium]